MLQAEGVHLPSSHDRWEGAADEDEHMTRLPDRMRLFHKHILNPLMPRLARSTRTPLAMIQHTGRRSGKSYQTPIVVEPLDGGFVIALMYGESTDWYRNLLASGQGTILWHGNTYALGKPERIESHRALPTFPVLARVTLCLLGFQQFASIPIRFSNEEGRASNLSISD